MHHSFYNVRAKDGGNLLTSCGKPFSFSNRSRFVTGLDSQVTCSACLVQLRAYRQHFPLASSSVTPVEVGGQTFFVPEMLGGAR